MSPSTHLALTYLLRRRPLCVAALLIACPADKDPLDTATVTATGTAGTASATGGATDTAGTASATGGADGQYCPGVEPWPPGSILCRTVQDCPMTGGEYICSLDGSGPDLGCGGCSEPCGTEFYPCEAPGTCVGNGLGCCGVCVADCTAGAMCQEGFVCDPNKPFDLNGHCAPISCEDGWTCADGEVCHPKAAPKDPHGCTAPLCDDPGGAPCSPNASCEPEVGCMYDKPCATDGDCACGTCIQSVCRDRPGICILLELPS